jgi:hypothetical protein
MGAPCIRAVPALSHEPTTWLPAMPPPFSAVHPAFAIEPSLSVHEALGEHAFALTLVGAAGRETRR